MALIGVQETGQRDDHQFNGWIANQFVVIRICLTIKAVNRFLAAIGVSVQYGDDLILFLAKALPANGHEYPSHSAQPSNTDANLFWLHH